MKVFAGTSGYAYDEWKGSFYPSDLRPADYLRHYATRLGAVEVNNTFYRMPRAPVIQAWCAAVPEDFRFVLKASRRITHLARLKEVEPALGYLVEAVRGLGARAGPTLFQLPPDLRADLARLEAFLERYPKNLRAAFEFRHPSWSSAETDALLRAHGVARVASEEDGEDAAPGLVATADFGYLRLRRSDYDAAAIARWAEHLRAQPWNDAWVFFKHEDGGAAPRFASALLAAMG